MDINNKNNKTIDEMLKEAHEEIEPIDSWQALRARIDNRIDSKKGVPTQYTRGIILWRRLAFGMAACFLVTAGILLYFLGVHYGVQEYQRQQMTVAHNLLNQTDLNHLNVAFSQVRQLFGQQSQWLLVGPSNNTQMGVTDKAVSEVKRNKIVAIRLAVKCDNAVSLERYFDIAVFSNQEAEFQLPLTDVLPIDVSLKPIVKSDGTIEMEIKATTGNSTESKSVNTLVGNRFISLIRMPANGKWVSVDGTGQVLSEI